VQPWRRRPVKVEVRVIAATNLDSGSGCSRALPGGPVLRWRWCHHLPPCAPAGRDPFLASTSSTASEEHGLYPRPASSWILCSWRCLERQRRSWRMHRAAIVLSMDGRCSTARIRFLLERLATARRSRRPAPLQNFPRSMPRPPRRAMDLPSEAWTSTRWCRRWRRLMLQSLQVTRATRSGRRAADSAHTSWRK